MAPKEPFHVHSLSKHIEDTKRGLTTETQHNLRSGANRVFPAVKQEGRVAEASIFGNNDSSDESSSEDDSSEGEDGAEFMRKLVGSARQPTAAPVPPKICSRDKISDSDAERGAATNKVASSQALKIKSNTDDISSSDSRLEKKKNHGNLEKDSLTSSGSESESGSESVSGSESDSDEESDDEDDGTKSSALEQSKADSTSESGSSESENESESDEPSESKPKSDLNGASASISDKSSANGDEFEKPTSTYTGSAASQSSSRSSEAAIHEAADESIHMEDRQHGSQQLAPPNSAPSSFMLRKSNNANGEDVARMCSQANLEGKQLWYFTVPSNLPISVVQTMEIPMDREQHGDQVFSHAGEDYGISFGTMASKSSIQILIPSVDGTQYRSGELEPRIRLGPHVSAKQWTAPGQVDKVMQIKRITQMSTGGFAFKAAEKGSAHVQPTGLRARFQTIGVNGAMGAIGDDNQATQDVEMPDTPPSPTTSVTVPAKLTKKGRKNKDKETAVERPHVATTSRKAKRKHPNSEDDAAAADEQLMTESQSAESQSKKPRRPSGSPVLGSEPLSSTPAKKQTPVLPPVVPTLTTSFSAGAVPSPVAASTPKVGEERKAKKEKAKKEKKTKKEKKVETEMHAPPSSQAPLTRKDTPVPLPRHTAVPIPKIPGSTPIPLAAAAASSSQAERNGTVGSSLQTLPPPSAQPAEKRRRKKHSAAQNPKDK